MERHLTRAVLVLILVLLSVPHLCIAANDIDIVTLDADGPDKAMPLGTNFYLQGPVEAAATEVYVLIVRTSWPLFNLWSADQDRCSELAKLGTPQLEKTKQHTSTNDLWPVDKGWDEPALVVGPWKRKEGTTTQQFKLLIPSDSLFRQGASYCLFSYAKQSATTNDISIFRKRLLELGEQVRGCVGDDETPGRQATCAGEEAQKLTTELTQDFKDVPDNETDAAWRAIRGAKVKGSDGQWTGLLDAALTFSLKSAKLTNTTGSWEAHSERDPDGTLYPVPTPPPPPLAANAAARARAAAERAAVASTVVPSPPKDESFGLPLMLAERLAAKGELARLDPGYKFGIRSVSPVLP